MDVPNEGTNEWVAWVARVTHGESTRQVAERIGKSHTTAQRWMRSGATPEQVIHFALAYNADLIEALVAAGWLPSADLEKLNLDSALKSSPTVKLAAELYRRAVAKERERRGEPPDSFEGLRPDRV